MTRWFNCPSALIDALSEPGPPWTNQCHFSKNRRGTISLVETVSRSSGFELQEFPLRSSCPGSARIKCLIISFQTERSSHGRGLAAPTPGVWTESGSSGLVAAAVAPLVKDFRFKGNEQFEKLLVCFPSAPTGSAVDEQNFLTAEVSEMWAADRANY